MANKAAKGSAFERFIARTLSLWWTASCSIPSDAIFWRTSNSGGRATTRGKKGKRTAGSYGDLAAIDPLGEKFLKCFTVEIKRGYSGCSIADLLDQPAKGAKPEYLKWIEKARETAKQAGSLSWMLIVKRDRREPVVFLDSKFMVEVLENNVVSTRFFKEPRLGQLALCIEDETEVAGFCLADFLERIPATRFPDMLEEMSHERI